MSARVTGSEPSSAKSPRTSSASAPVKSAARSMNSTI